MSQRPVGAATGKSQMHHITLKRIAIILSGLMIMAIAFGVGIVVPAAGKSSRIAAVLLLVALGSSGGWSFALLIRSWMCPSIADAWHGRNIPVSAKLRIRNSSSFSSGGVPRSIDGQPMSVAMAVGAVLSLVSLCLFLLFAMDWPQVWRAANPPMAAGWAIGIAALPHAGYVMARLIFGTPPEAATRPRTVFRPAFWRMTITAGALLIMGIVLLTVLFWNRSLQRVDPLMMIFIAGAVGSVPLLYMMIAVALLGEQLVEVRYPESCDRSDEAAPSAEQESE